MRSAWPVSASASTYRILLWAFPERFRSRFGDEIISAFTDVAAEAWHERGFGGLARLWIKTLADLARNGSSERWGNDSLREAPPPRQPRKGNPMDTILQDLRFAFRTLAKRPGFTAAVVATLALGIGVNTSIFTVVNGIVLRPLPFPDSERAVILCETNDRFGDYCIASPPNVEDWSRASNTIDTFGVARSYPFVLNEPDGSQSVRGAIATPGYFEVHGVEPAMGRLLQPADMDPGNNQVAVISNGFWQSRFAGDPGAVGSRLTIEGKPFTVVGVLPPDTWIHDFNYAQIWAPLSVTPDDITERGWRGFVALGRLADGANLDQARQEMQAIRDALAEDFPQTNESFGVQVERLREHVAGPVAGTLMVFLFAVTLVLLIGCANVANLLLVRATWRNQEFAVRSSLGAGRGRLVRQLLTESLLLAAVGGIVGLVLAVWSTGGFRALAPGNIPRLGEVSVDATVLAFSALLSLATAILFGLTPARRAATSDLTETLKSTRHTDARGGRVRGVLVVGELALALMLLIGAGLLVRGFLGLLDWDPGFDRRNLVTVWTLAPFDKYREGRQVVEMFHQGADSLRALPGVTAIGMTSAGPLFGGRETDDFFIEGRSPVSPDERPSVRWFDVGPEYFATMGIELVRGRYFTAADNGQSVPVAIINETMANRHFAGEDPLGQRVTIHERTVEIVGVVRDVRPFRPDESSGPEIYWPKRQEPRWATYYVIRTEPKVTGIEAAVRRQLARIEPDLQVAGFVPLDEIADRQLIEPRFNVLLVGLFAAIAVALAAIGTYGVIAYSVASRTHEIGVRIALGARPGAITGAIVRSGMILALLGIGLGVAGALMVGRFLSSLLYGVPPTDSATFGVVVGLFAVISLAACWVPARRAARLDPLIALRAE